MITIETGSQNVAWLLRAVVLAGSSLARYRLPAEVDFIVDEAKGSRLDQQRAAVRIRKEVP